VAEAVCPVQEDDACLLDRGLDLHHDVEPRMKGLGRGLQALDRDYRNARLLGQLGLAPAEQGARGADLQIGDQRNGP
jgi:hypothetical protein